MSSISVYVVDLLSKMATQAKADLVKIGMEGFALLDEYYGRSRRPSVHHRSQVPKKQPEIMMIVRDGTMLKKRGGCGPPPPIFLKY